jgi:hypothetical protein
MAIEDNILDGLDLSVLDSIAKSPEKKEKQEETAGVETKTEEPGIFNPELRIQEVDELPNQKEEVQQEDKVSDELEEANTKEDTKEEVPESSESSKEEEPVEEEANPIRIFAELQRDQGLIDFSDDDFEDSEEWLLARVQNTIDSKVDEYKENMPDEIKYLLDNYEAGVNMYDLLNIGATKQSYDKITEDNLKDNSGLQKMLVKDLLAKSGWSEDRIGRKLSRYEDTGVLQEEAEDALASLKEIQKNEEQNLIKTQKEEQQKRVKAHEQWLDDLNDHIGKKEEILPGFKLSPKDKSALYKGITKLDRNGENEIMRMRKKDPEFDLKIAYLATVLKWDFSAFERQSTTKSTRKLADAIKSTKKTGSRPSRGTSKAVNFDTMRKSLR